MIFAVDLHFDDRQFAPPGERGALRIDAVDRNSDISRRQLGGNMPNQNEFVDQIDAIDRDQEAILPNLVGKMRHQPVDKLHILQRLQRQADGNLDLVIGRGELHRVGEHPRDHELRQSMKERIARAGNVVGRRHDAPGGMADAHERLRPARHQRMRIDF